MPGTLTSQNTMMKNGPSSVVPLPVGSILNGRYAANSVQSSFSQVPYSGSLEHLGVTSRGGSELYPSLGNMGSCVTNSMGNFASGSNTGRSLSSVGGLREPGIVSRPNLVGNGVSGDTRAQGLMDGVLPQGLLQKQIAAVFQQNQEFSIQNEDFPALPRYKGGASDHPVDMHIKDHILDYDISKIQNQPLPIERTTGFGLTHSFASVHQQHHPISNGGLSMFHTSNQDVHARGSDLLPSSHLNYYQQGRSIDSPSIGVKHINLSNTLSTGGPFARLIEYELHRQSQLHLQQMQDVGSYRKEELATSKRPLYAAADTFDLMGLLYAIQAVNPSLSYLSLGFDLMSIGLNLNSQEELHKRFASPWCSDPVKEDPQFKIPECYNAKGVSSLDILPFPKFPLEALFYTFYSMPKDEAQLYAANELINRGWCYHKELRVWLMREPNIQPLVKTTSYESGSYWCFDPNRWSPLLKENFVLQYDLIEERPTTGFRKEQGHQQRSCKRAGSPFYSVDQIAR